MPAPGYYDLPGSRMLQGGRLAASPDFQGQARSMPGIDIPTPGSGPPVTGDYMNSIPGAGLPLRNGEIGGLGAPDFNPVGTNIPLNDQDVAPTAQNIYHSLVMNAARNAYPSLRGQPTADDWRQNASAPPVNIAPQVPIPQGAGGVGGQGGSFFTQSGNPGFGVPGGIGFDQSSMGQNAGGMFSPRRQTGPMSAADWHGLMGESGWAHLLANYPGFDRSYKDYTSNPEWQQAAPVAPAVAGHPRTPPLNPR